MTRSDRGALRVVQVSFHRDPLRRPAETLLDEWYTMPAAAAGAARSGVDVSVVQAAHVRQELHRDGVPFFFVDDSCGMQGGLSWGLNIPRRPDKILRRVISLAPQVVHVHGFVHPWAVRQLAVAIAPVPVLVQDHGAVPPSGWRRKAWRVAYERVTALAFTAREQAEPFFRAGALRADVPVFPVLGGSSRFRPGDQRAARAATGVFGDPCYIWTSNLTVNKDPLTMLDAFERVAARLPDARLWCCFAHAPLLDLVRRRIGGSATLRERVTLVGARAHHEMELYFRSADFFIQTSHREASGFSLLEALSCGVTPLVTDIPATRRIVGDTGSLTPVGDTRALAEAMMDWAERDRAMLRLMARQRFETSLSFDAIGRELYAAYFALARGI